MTYLWIVAIGFILCLGIVGGVLLFSIRSAVNPQDASKIDPIDSPNRNN